MEPSFYEEPIKQCPECGKKARAEWVDVGFGPYSQQAGPYYCICGWVEKGCPAETKDRCHQCISWDYCQGKSRED